MSSAAACPSNRKRACMGGLFPTSAPYEVTSPAAGGACARWRRRSSARATTSEASSGSKGFWR